MTISDQTGLEILGSIRHSDPRRSDRVTLYRGADGMVWSAAADEDPYPTDTPVGRQELAWSGPDWDYMPAGTVR